jgi:hypothetical protein
MLRTIAVTHRGHQIRVEMFGQPGLGIEGEEPTHHLESPRSRCILACSAAATSGRAALRLGVGHLGLVGAYVHEVAGDRVDPVVLGRVREAVLDAPAPPQPQEQRRAQDQPSARAVRTGGHVHADCPPRYASGGSRHTARPALRGTAQVDGSEMDPSMCANRTLLAQVSYVALADERSQLAS